MTLAEQIIEAASEVHTLLGGPGLLESVYESALCYELSLRHIAFQRQLPVPVLYKGRAIRRPLFIDLLIENQIVVEIKAVEVDNPYYLAQLSTHLRFMNLEKGLLINFGKPRLEDGLTRIAV